MALAGQPQYEKPPAGSGILLGGGTSKSPHQPGEQLHLFVDRASPASQTWLFFARCLLTFLSTLGGRGRELRSRIEFL